MSKLISILLVCVVLFGMVSCTPDNSNETTEGLAQTQTPEDETTASGETASDTTEAQPPKPESPFGINMSDLNDLMQPIFSGNTVKNETVMFLEKGDVKTLLYPIDSIISVTSYDGSIVYKEGKDYELVDGKIKVLEKSSIPCITKANYYNVADNKLVTNYDGKMVNTYWGENKMYQWQVNVNYTHSSEWTGFKQESQSDVFENFIKKLMNGEDVTVIFYGDSITNGANASWLSGYAPYQRTYPMLFTEALADLFDYTVKYVRVDDSLANTPKVPTEDYVAGTRGTITYINTAVGGWRSSHGLDSVLSYVIFKAKTHGCDLLVLGFGMNDKGVAPADTKNNLKEIANGVLSVQPDASIALIATMLPNNNSNKKWFDGQDKQIDALKELAQEYLSDKVACGVCDMTSLSSSVLERKDFHDYSGNNINHPNDFFCRVYAQTLLQTVIGYENMN